MIKMLNKLVPYMVLLCLWWLNTKDQYWLNQKECLGLDHLSYVSYSLIKFSSWKLFRQIG